MVDSRTGGHLGSQNIVRISPPFTNEIFSQIQTTGIRPDHARRQGIRGSGAAGSEAAANEDLSRAQQDRADFLAVAQASGLPPALLPALASRETRVAAPGILRNGYGVAGAYGMFQIMPDPWGVVSPATGRRHMEQAAYILGTYYF